MIVLFLQNKGFRYIEALVASLIAVDRRCALPTKSSSRGPALWPLLAGLVPTARDRHQSRRCSTWPSASWAPR